MIRFLKIVVDLLSVLKTSLGYLGVGQSDDARLAIQYRSQEASIKPGIAF
jgi:hypothetical protein